MFDLGHFYNHRHIYTCTYICVYDYTDEFAQWLNAKIRPFSVGYFPRCIYRGGNAIYRRGRSSRPSNRCFAPVIRGDDDAKHFTRTYSRAKSFPITPRHGVSFLTAAPRRDTRKEIAMARVNDIADGKYDESIISPSESLAFYDGVLNQWWLSAINRSAVTCTGISPRALCVSCLKYAQTICVLSLSSVYLR